MGWDPKLRLPWPVLTIAGDGVVEVTGAGNAPAIGSALSAWVAPSHQAELARAITERSSVEAPLASGGWIRLTVLPDPDEQGRVIAIAEDISARKREETRLRHRERLLVDAQGVAHLGVWEWDLETQRVIWSEELFRMYGLDPSGHQPTYADYLTRVHPDDRQRVSEATAAAIEEKRAYSHDERVYRSDGEMRHLHTWAEPVLDANGELVRLVGVCQDVTARKVAEEKSAWKSTLLHVASHEIKNPLSPMLLVLEQLTAGRYGPMSASQSDAVSLVMQQAQRISHLVRDLVDVALIEQGRLHFEPREFDLVPLVRRVAETFRPLGQRWGVSLDDALEGELAVNADPDRLEQVAVNLLSNAVKFTPQGRVVRVFAERVGSDAVVSVIDEGPGLDDEQRERLFVAFGEPGMPQHGGSGSGLGLFISKSLVEAHGGRLWCESTPGRGCTFSFAVPTG
jgi:PAS domain S-box-containing protein